MNQSVDGNGIAFWYFIEARLYLIPPINLVVWNMKRAVVIIFPVAI